MNSMPELPQVGSDGVSSGWVINTVLAMLGTAAATVAALVKFIQGGYAQTITDLKKDQEDMRAELCSVNKRCDELTEEAAKCREDRASLKTHVEYLLKQESK